MSTDDEATRDSRVPIARGGTRERPWAHLQPILDAELAWGNRLAAGCRGFRLLDPHHGSYGVDLGEPLHLDRLRARFRLPAEITLAVLLPCAKHKGSMGIGDAQGLIVLNAPLPADWSGGEGTIPWDPEEES